MRLRSVVCGVMCFSAMLIGACTERPSAGELSVIVSDSAGIEIVTNRARAWSGADAWGVADTPVVRIGALDGPPELTLGNVRAVGWLPDGRIFVGDEQVSSVRVYSPDGEPLQTIGGQGEGPGELQWFLTVSTYRGDSLFVYDYSQRAVSVFAPDLSFARRFRNPLLEGNYWIQAALDDGRFLLTSFGETRLSGGPGIVPDSSSVVIASPDGSSVDTVGSFQIGLRRVGEGGMVQASFLLPYAAVAAAGNRVLWTAGEPFEYTEIDPDGELVRIVRIMEEPVPVTQEVIRQFQEYYVDLVTGGGHGGPEGAADRARELVRGAEYPAVLPATGAAVKIDPYGHRWVGRYNPTGTSPAVWEVFDRSGAWQGTVETPQGLEVHEVGTDQIIGVTKDEYDVAYVQVHALHR